MFISIQTRKVWSLLLPLALVVLLVFAGCLAKRHAWYYRIEADVNPTVSLGDWDLVVKVSDLNWDKGRVPKPVYHVSACIKTFYRGEVTDTGSQEQVPLIVIDSICIQLPVTDRLVCSEIGTSKDTAQLFWHRNEWIGPYFCVGADIPRQDTIITVSFVAVMSHRMSEAEMRRQRFSLDLRRFHGPYRISMQ